MQHTPAGQFVIPCGMGLRVSIRRVPSIVGLALGLRFAALHGLNACSLPHPCTAQGRRGERATVGHCRVTLSPIPLCLACSAIGRTFTGGVGTAPCTHARSSNMRTQSMACDAARFYTCCMCVLGSQNHACACTQHHACKGRQALAHACNGAAVYVMHGKKDKMAPEVMQPNSLHMSHSTNNSFPAQDQGPLSTPSRGVSPS